MWSHRSRSGESNAAGDEQNVDVWLCGHACCQSVQSTVSLDRSIGSVSVHSQLAHFRSSESSSSPSEQPPSLHYLHITASSCSVQLAAVCAFFHPLILQSTLQPSVVARRLLLLQYCLFECRGPS